MHDSSTLAGDPDLAQGILESAPDALVIADRDGRIVLVNRRTEKLFGYSRAELLGQPMEILLPERSRSRHCQRRAGYFDDPQERLMAEGLKVLGLRKDGSEFTVEVRLSFVETKAGLMVSSAIRDVRELREVDENIHKLNDELAFRVKELQTLLDVIPVGIAIADDPECKRIVGNRRLAQILNLPVEANFSLNAAPEERPPLKAYRDGRELAPHELPLRRAAAEGVTVEEVELDILGPDGKVRKLQGSAEPLFDSHGKICGSVGSFADVTKRRRAERYLALQYAVTGVLATAHSLVEAVPNLIQCICAGLGWELGEIWEVDREANVIGWSRMWHVHSLDAHEIEAISYGAKFFRGEGLVGSVWLNGQPRWVMDLIAERDIRRHSALVEIGLRGAIAFPVRSGEEVNAVMAFFSRSSSEPDADLLRILMALGRQIGDFIERKQTEKALQESAARYRTLFEGSKDIIMLTTSRGKLLDANPAAVASFGYASKEDFLKVDVGQHLYFDPNRRASFLRQIEEEGYVRNFDLKAKRSDGQTLNLLVTAMASRDPRTDRVQFWAIGRDVTEEKRAEQALRELSGRLLRLQDEERRRIARELHDTTVQSLAALGMYFSLVDKSITSDDPKIRKVLSDGLGLAEQCAREIRTVSYLLHPPLLDELGLVSTLQSYVEGFERRSGISINLCVSSEIGRLPQDVELTLFRIVQEGLANVHRHSNSKTAEINLACDGGRVRLELKDEGRGIPPGVLDRLTRGTVMLGVGVAGMRERVRQLQGQLEIDSGSQGTTVRAVIPLAQSPGD